MVTGYNFNASYTAKCRFGVSDVFVVVDAKVISETKMICISPKKFSIPKAMRLPLDVPLEIAFSKTDEFPWTRSKNKFRFYKLPKIATFEPTEVNLGEQTEVTITTKEDQGFWPQITGMTSEGDFDIMHTIVCKFGDFDLVPAVFTDEYTIKCLTPANDMSYEEDPSLKVNLELALNGQDFEKIGKFVFNGVGEPVDDDDSSMMILIIGGGIALVIGCCLLFFLTRGGKKGEQ
jgi:hypothetical protein